MYWENKPIASNPLTAFTFWKQFWLKFSGVLCLDLVSINISTGPWSNSQGIHRKGKHGKVCYEIKCHFPLPLPAQHSPWRMQPQPWRYTRYQTRDLKERNHTMIHFLEVTPEHPALHPIEGLKKENDLHTEITVSTQYFSNASSGQMEFRI